MFENFFKKSSKPEMSLGNSETSLADLGNTQKPIRFGYLVLLIGFGGFLLWSFLLPLDEGSPSSGTVVVDARRKLVQHVTGGNIKTIYVKESQLVKVGDPLIQLLDITQKANLEVLGNQENLLRKNLMALKDLVLEGYYPRQQYEELQRQHAEVIEKLKIAKEEFARTTIRSPIDGHIMGLSVTEGGVVTPGMKIMEVVPDQDKLVVEAQVLPFLIDKIQPGLNADVRFSALNQRVTPVIQGKVVWISPDKYMDSNNPNFSMGYYKVRVELTTEKLQALGDQELHPGMPADVIIKTGHRTFMSYLIKPFTDRAAMSLMER